MFQIDFSFFFCYYLTGSIFFFFFCWLWDQRPVLRRSWAAADRFWQCAVCTHAYFESKNVKISACPLCGTLNQKHQEKEGG